METPRVQAARSPPHQQEPHFKKPQMSSTTTSDDETTAGADTTRKIKFKRRKIAIFFAYCGVGYQGMQKNPGAKTIEGEIEEALYLSGAVPEPDRGNPRRYDWARSARTDKGVSAVGQVVSGRFYVDPPGLVERLNSNLPDQIRVFGYKRATSGFNAKKFCDRRRYVYLIPVFALDPSCHRDRESVLASAGSGVELVKCLECSERGRKVEGVMGKRNFDSKTKKASNVDANLDSDIRTRELLNYMKENTIASSENYIAEVLPPELKTVVSESGIISNNGNAKVDSEVEKESDSGKNPNSESVKEANVLMDDGVSNIAAGSAISPQDQGTDVSSKEMVKEENNGHRDEKLLRQSEFTYGENEKERFNRVLNYYVGTRNFHNFTTRTKAEDPAAKRYIISFDASTIVTVEGIEFVKCEVVGQSFMLHQIRKMIGLAVAIMRNCAPESLIETAFRKDVNINVPMAPEVGLYLDECFFTSYNQKWKDSLEELSMRAYKEEAEEFKMKQIYTHIASTEHKEGIVALWLHSLNHRNYPDLRFVTDSGEIRER